MSPFTAHRLRFTLEVLQPLTLPEPRGAALRGALFESLWRQHCEYKAAPTCTACPLAASCPVGLLVATLEPAPRARAALRPTPKPGFRPQSTRSETNPRSVLSVVSVAESGGQLPRPYTIEPPITASGRYAAGQRLTFGLTLFAGARDLVPYLIGAVRQWRTSGIGARQPALNGRRSRVRLLRVLAENPFTAQRQVLWASSQQSYRPPDRPEPALAITAAHVATTAQNWPLDERGVVRLTFHTPTRLIARGQLVRSPQPRVLVARLVQRLRALGQAFAAGDPPGLPGDDPKTLLAHADAITLQADETAWVDQWSPSRRLRRTTPIGGFVGRASWEGERAAMRALLPWLLWGSIVHVGKDTVKGNGWYHLGAPEAGVACCAPTAAGRRHDSPALEGRGRGLGPTRLADAP